MHNDELRSSIGPSGCSFIEDIIDGMNDWVRVINTEGTLLFINKSMRLAIGANSLGKKCYEVLGRTDPCPNCVTWHKQEKMMNLKEEVVNGRYYSISSSPLRNSYGEIEAYVEVFHDITEIRTISKILEAQNAKLKEDLMIARRLQCNLLPKKNSLNDKLDFSYIYKPCETLGGDFLDIFKIDDSHVGIYIADVSGHGVAASMLTMFLRAALDKSQLSPAKVLESLYNDFSKSGFDDDLYIAVFYGILNLENYSFTYSNAGLNVVPIVFSGDNYQLLRVAGIPISTWVECPVYNEKMINISSGDRLFFYTDGIIEIKNNKKEQFGEDRLISHIQETKDTPAEILSSLIDKATSFAGTTSKDILDDITVSIVEIK